MSLRMRGAMTAVAGVLALAATAAAGPLQDDLAARRARLMEKLGPDAMAIVWSAPTRVYSLDVDYEFRQDSHLLYLTGMTQEETILVLMPGNRTRKEILFTREPNPRREHWNGHILTKEEATAQSGIATVYYAGEFEAFVTAMFNQQLYGGKRNEVSNEFDAFFAAVGANRARLALAFGPRPAPSAPLTPAYEFAAKARDRFLNVSFVDTWPMISELRQIKTTYEQTQMEKSGLISSNAHIAGMAAAKPGRFEYEVESAIEQVYMANGAMTWGYPSIVGSGPNATILHYNASNRQMQAGDILLVDAAGNYQGYTVDITRSYPISGSYTEAQKDLYRLVLAAQDAGMAAAKIGNKTADVEKAAEEVVKAGLLKLGLITDASRRAVPHLVHPRHLPLDRHGRARRRRLPAAARRRHDLRGRARRLHPPAGARRAARHAREPQVQGRRSASAVEKYKFIGIRIEDSFLLTDTGLKRLSATVPRTIEEVERFMKSGERPSTSSPQGLGD